MGSIPAANPYEYETVDVLDSHMAYIDTGGAGNPIVFSTATRRRRTSGET